MYDGYMYASSNHSLPMCDFLTERITAYHCILQHITYQYITYDAIEPPITMSHYIRPTFHIK